MNKSANPLVAICPSCDSRVRFERRPRLGDAVVCNECEEMLKVVQVKPLKVDWSFMGNDENWDDADYGHHGNFRHYRNGRYYWD